MKKLISMIAGMLMVAGQTARAVPVRDIDAVFDIQANRNVRMNAKAWTPFKIVGVASNSADSSVFNITGDTGTVGFKNDLSSTSFWALASIAISNGPAGIFTAEFTGAMWGTNITAKTRYWGDVRLSTLGNTLPSIELWLYPSANQGDETSYISPSNAVFQTNGVDVTPLTVINFESNFVFALTGSVLTIHSTAAGLTNVYGGTNIDVTGTGQVRVVNHADTSTQTNIDNSAGYVVADLSFDDDGHVITGGVVNLDDRYYTETEVDTIVALITLQDVTDAGNETTNSIIIGIGTAPGLYALSQGTNTVASGDYSLASGEEAEAIGDWSQAFGFRTKAYSTYGHAEGYFSIASNGIGAHAEGNSKAYGIASHSEGLNTEATGDYSHAEGFQTKAYGIYSHAEGQRGTASGNDSHAEGDNTTASGDSSHAEGNATTASGAGGSHSEGCGTVASGESSHAEGCSTESAGKFSHAAGWRAVAEHNYTYVWSDGHSITSPAANTYLVYASNGIVLLGGPVMVGTNAAPAGSRFVVAYNGTNIFMVNEDAVDFGGFRGTNAAEAIEDTDFTTLGQVENLISVGTSPHYFLTTTNSYLAGSSNMVNVNPQSAAVSLTSSFGVGVNDTNFLAQYASVPSNRVIAEGRAGIQLNIEPTVSFNFFAEIFITNTAGGAAVLWGTTDTITRTAADRKVDMHAFVTATNLSTTQLFYVDLYAVKPNAPAGTLIWTVLGTTGIPSNFTPPPIVTLCGCDLDASLLTGNVPKASMTNGAKQMAGDNIDWDDGDGQFDAGSGLATDTEVAEATNAVLHEAQNFANATNWHGAMAITIPNVTNAVHNYARMERSYYTIGATGISANALGPFVFNVHVPNVSNALDNHGPMVYTGMTVVASYTNVPWTFTIDPGETVDIVWTSGSPTNAWVNINY